MECHLISSIFLPPLCSWALTFIFRIFHSLLPPSAANEQESPADSATLTFDLSFTDSQRSQGPRPSTEEHWVSDNCMQVSVQGYNFAYAGAERTGMKADVNTNSKTWHGTGSGA